MSAPTATQLVEAWHKEWLETEDPHWGDRIDWSTADALAAKLDEAMAPEPVDCDKAPAGHYCTHQIGHDGPCRVFPNP